MSRRARRKQETSKRIEEAGRRLFELHGYEATSTRAIADAADIAAGTFFNYFPEKRSLLLHLMRQEIDEAIDRAFEESEPRAIEQELLHVFGALTECHAKDRRLSRVFIKELLFVERSQRAEAASWTFAIVQRIAAMLGRAQERGELEAGIDPLEAAQQIFSMHYFGLVTWLGGTIPSRAVHEERFEASLRLLLRGLRRSVA